MFETLSEEEVVSSGGDMAEATPQVPGSGEEGKEGEGRRSSLQPERGSQMMEYKYVKSAEQGTFS